MLIPSNLFSVSDIEYIDELKNRAVKMQKYGLAGRLVEIRKELTKELHNEWTEDILTNIKNDLK